MPLTRNFLQVPFSSKGLRRFPKGERKALWSPPQRRNPAKQRKARKPPSLPSIRNLFLVRGFVRLRADEVLSPRGKVPKGRHRRIRRSQSDLAFAKRKPTLGGQGVHAAWPPPVPPLLRNSAPLASQGRAQRGSRPSLGGPLSPTAQLIPPPAPRRRIIPGVMAGGRCGRITVRRDVSRYRGHVRRVLVWHSIGCWFRAKANDAPDNTDPVGRVTRGSAHCTGRSNVASKEHGHRASKAKPSAWRVCSLLHLRRQHGHMGLAG